MVNPRLPALFQNIDAALTAFLVFIRALTEEGAKLYGSEGSNAGMLRASKAMNLCFDWTQWVRRRPTKACVNEFGFLCDLLQPLLRHTRYPSIDDFPDVRHAWPDSGVSRGAFPGITSCQSEARPQAAMASGHIADAFRKFFRLGCYMIIS